MIYDNYQGQRVIEAVVFDCYGVLATDGWLPFKCRYFGSDRRLLAQAGELNRLADSGQISQAVFFRQVAVLAGIKPAAARREIKQNRPNDELFAFIQSMLKPRYKIGLLSNAGADWLSRIFIPAQLKLFDAVALSFQTGFLKPAPEAYRDIADRLGVKPNKCLLIDDQERYCRGAEDGGMAAICFRSNSQIQQEMSSLLGLGS